MKMIRRLHQYYVRSGTENRPVLNQKLFDITVGILRANNQGFSDSESRSKFYPIRRTRYQNAEIDYKIRKKHPDVCSP